MSCAKLRFHAHVLSHNQVRGQFKGPSGAFVTYCNISCFNALMPLKDAHRMAYSVDPDQPSP